MKNIILSILILFFLVMDLFSEKGTSFYGGNLIFNQASLNEPETKGSGFGADLLYQSFLSLHFSYLMNLQFLYNNYSNTFQDIYYTGEDTKINYTKEEAFYNISWGLKFQYNLILHKFIPYLSLGLNYNFIYKTFNYAYEQKPGTLITDEEQSRWLPTTLGFLFGCGGNYKVGNRDFIHLGFEYLYILYEETNKNFGYNNIIILKAGYLRSTDFKL